MPVTNPIHTVSVRELDCRGTAVVTLGFSAAPELLYTPADVVLALDRSGCGTDQSMTLLKAGAETLLDLLCAASGGRRDTAGNGTRLGLVTCGGCTRTVVPLCPSVSRLKQRISALTPCGPADHAGALIRAQALLGPCCGHRRRVIVLFVDGTQPLCQVPDVIAQHCREAGTELFCIALGEHLPPLEDLVSAPADQHLFVTGFPGELPCLFREAGCQIARAGALHAVLEETLSGDFELVQVDRCDSGTLRQTAARTLRWTPDPVGVTGPETVRLVFTIRHCGDVGGRKPIARSLLYRDQRGSCLRFPSPRVQVCCPDGPLFPDACPPAREIPMDPCQECAEVDLGDVDLEALGRIVYVNVTLRKLCPNKRTAVAVLLSEVDPCGDEIPRGRRIFTIPAREGTECRDLVLNCIRFVVPEERCTCGGCGCSCSSLCTPRTFRARVLANYLDTDSICCGGEASL